ncbi:hypothetical protein BD408DRAFT_438068 [Parasitella parasitica]|nr:hypothetical protein BD408DRAFT_438068 [Parasitella parasitica]
MSLLDPYSNIETIDSSINTAYTSPTILNPSDTSFATLRVGTLNCRGLTKTAASSTRRHFIRYLRTCSLALLALQETHASITSTQDQFHLQFQAKSSIWSKHCGLVSFYSGISFSNTIVSICGRIISTTISHASPAFEPFSITVVYFPASRSECICFLSTILTDFHSVFSSSSSHSIIRGATPSVTFQRGSSQSCNDHIFLPSDLSLSVQYEHCRTSVIQPPWSDYFLLSCQLRLYPAADASFTLSVGKGSWRAHPLLASNLVFRRRLHRALSGRVQTLDPTLSAAQKWDELKQRTTATVAKSFSRRNAYTLKRAEDYLHKKRTGIQQQLTLDPTMKPVLNPQLTIVEEQLAAIQQYHVEALALRSGVLGVNKARCLLASSRNPLLPGPQKLSSLR